MSICMFIQEKNMFALILPCFLPLILPLSRSFSLSSVSLSWRKEASVLDGPEGTPNNTEIMLHFFFNLWQHSFILFLLRRCGLLQSLTILLVSTLQLQYLVKLGRMASIVTMNILDPDLWIETNSWGLHWHGHLSVSQMRKILYALMRLWIF